MVGRYSLALVVAGSALAFGLVGTSSADVDGGSKWRRGAVESGGASSVKVSEG